MTRHPRLLAFAATLLVAGPATAQTPTPTPTPTPTAPPAIESFIPATATWWGPTTGGSYDAANLVLDPDGTIWTASASENDVVKLLPDRKKVVRWVFGKDAAPSSLLKEPDGTFWVTELGGFNIAHFDPTTGALTEWPDTARRPTALVKNPDGTLWLPETNGTLARFDPATGTFTYFKTEGTTSLSYPWRDADGSVWTCDFQKNTILKFSPDASQVTRWPLPPNGFGPSKVFRAADGKIWISLYGSGYLAHLDEATSILRMYILPSLSAPFDMANYKGRILYSEQRYGHIGLLDPKATKPYDVRTLTPETLTPTSTTETKTPVSSTLTPEEIAVVLSDGISFYGVKTFGLAAFPAANGSAYGLALDEKRGRIYFSTFGNIGALRPFGPSGDPHEQYVPAAASVSGAGGARWQTQTVLWNRGTPPPTPTPNPTPPPTPTPNPTPAPVSLVERLHPTGWIAGLSPAKALEVGPSKLVAQDDLIGVDMNAPESAGGIRFASYDTSKQPLSDLFVWARTFTTREDGGRYGFARNAVKASRGVAALEQAFFFTPGDTSWRTNGGLFTIENASGSVVIVDAAGQERASMSFDWPAGYQWQASTVFSEMGLSPLPSARVVFRVETGRILPFGIAIDPVTNDPIGLSVFPLKSQTTRQTFYGVARGGGLMGATSHTDLQVHNPTAAPARVALTFRPASGLEAPPPGAPVSGELAVPAGATVFFADVLSAAMGLDGAFGTLELSSDEPVYAFASVTAAAELGGRFGFGMAGALLDDALVPPWRGVFIAATDDGWDQTTTTLYLDNPADAEATATLVLTNEYGDAAGTRGVTVGPHESRFLPAVWYSIAGYGVRFGRVDVVPSDGSPPLAAVLLRQDQKTRDTDPVVPFVIPR